MTNFDVIVIGGGPAGLMAAGQAAAASKKVLLIEKMDTPGRKLLLTGKHRCNLTNTTSIEQALSHFNPGGRFLTQLFYKFYCNELRLFFLDLGLETEVQRGGRVFPTSEKAQDVLDALLVWVNKLGVNITTKSTLTSLTIDNNKIRGIDTSAGSFQAPSVILATGGKAYPGTGSTGDGYSLAEKAGHNIIPVMPALVPLRTKGGTAQALQGLSLKNISAAIWIDGNKQDELFGELLFTHFGISGPVILTLSRQAVQALEENKMVEISIDLKPALDPATLDKRIMKDIQSMGKKQFKSLLIELLPKKLIPICLDQTGIPGDKKISQISGEERKKLRSWLKDDFRFVVTDHMGFGQAIITAGGVDTTEVNPATMESKLIKGLFFAGEILDIDADTGGYNLQAAFSTGWAAGKAAGNNK